jgi:hypothetical protein
MESFWRVCAQEADRISKTLGTDSDTAVGSIL